MKILMTVISLLTLSLPTFAIDLQSFKQGLKKDLAISRALFDCVGEGQQLNEVYEISGLIDSAKPICNAALEKAMVLGATREDILKSLELKLKQ